MKLEQITFINEQGKRVTDSLIVAEHFGIEHKNVLRGLKRTVKLNAEIEGSIEDGSSGSSPLFIESFYINAQKKRQPKYEITEKGFYILMMNIKGGTKVGVSRLHKVRMDFVNAFFELRREFNELLAAYKLLAEKFLPLDEQGHISVFNGKQRQFITHGYFTSRRTRNEATPEINRAFNVVFKSSHKLNIIPEVEAHEKNKIKSSSKAVPSKACVEYTNSGEMEIVLYEKWMYEEKRYGWNKS